MSKNLVFEKYTGTGNSFLICDLRIKANKDAFQKMRPKIKNFIRKSCDLHFGIGADGVVFIQTAGKSANQLAWDFYNADGSSAEMCGNAARCVGLAAHRRHPKISAFQIQTRAGWISATVQSLSRDLKQGFIAIQMPPIKDFESQIPFSRALPLSFVNSGVPHAVVVAKKLSTLFKPIHSPRELTYFRNLSVLVSEIRALKRFKKSGTNVTFYQQTGKSSIVSLTFERGVQGFTLACGTGAVAAATTFLKGGRGQVNVQVPGGKLKVDFNGSSPHLYGPAEFLGEISIPV